MRSHRQTLYFFGRRKSKQGLILYRLRVYLLLVSPTPNGKKVESKVVIEEKLTVMVSFRGMLKTATAPGVY